MAKELKIRWIILAAGIALFMQVQWHWSGSLPLTMKLSFGFFLAIYLVAGFESFRGFQENVMQKKNFR